MKDATITSTENTNIKAPAKEEFNLGSRFPSIITTDDLVLQLGLANIKVANHEKLLTGVYARLGQTEQALAEIQPKLIAAKQNEVAAAESNKLYEANNRKLSDSLRDLNKEREQLASNAENWQRRATTGAEANSKLHTELDDVREAWKAEAASLSGKLDVATKKAERLKKQLANLKKKVKNGKHSSN